MVALQSSELDKDLKPAILSCFGDMAMAVGTGFRQFVPDVMYILRAATQTQVEQNNADQVEYLHRLHLAILEAFTGIVHSFDGLQASDVQQEAVYAQFMLAFAMFVYESHTGAAHTSELLSMLLGLVGDMATILGALVPAIKQECASNAAVQALIQEGSQIDELRDTANYACNAL